MNKNIKIGLMEYLKDIKNNKLYSFLTILSSALTAILAFYFTVIINKLIDLINLTINGNLDKSVAIKYFIIFGGYILLDKIVDSLYSISLELKALRSEELIKNSLYVKINKFKLLKFEIPAFLDAFDKALANVFRATYFLLQIDMMVFNYGLYFIITIIYLNTLNIWLNLIIIAIIIPTLIGKVIQFKVGIKSEDESAILRRKIDKYSEYVSTREYYKETLHLGAFPFFLKRLGDSLKSLTKVKIKEEYSKFKIDLVLNIFKFSGYICAIFIIFKLTINHEITVSQMVALIGTLNIIFYNIEMMLGFHLSNLINFFVPVKKMHELLDDDEMLLEEYTDKVEAEETRTITDMNTLELNNVSFKYPTQETYALKNINVKLNEGETVCIVGVNGSGKTTLSKILLGLYEPTEGNLKLNGIELKDNDLRSLRRISTSVFQDFMKYPLTLKENLMLARSNEIKKITDDEIEELNKELGFNNLNYNLDNGYDTLLSKEFGGTDLSKGQWQRVAILRGMFKRSPLVILDEPTASIDPILEMELLRTMMDEKIHKTKIVITHRIGMATKADRILVMKDGKIIEDGNHKELMLKDGEYKKLFQGQSKWFNN